MKSLRLFTPSRGLALVAMFILCLAAGCQGDVSAESPFHLNPNMDQQNRLDPQEPNAIFDDGRSMRLPPAGTVQFDPNPPNDALHSHLFGGRVQADYARTLPATGTDGQAMSLSENFVRRGQSRYNIYCAPCHDGAGTGRGVVVERGMMKPPSFHEDRIRGMAVGQFFHIITHGVRNMQPYAAQIPVNDRWAIATYVRALQMSQNADLSQIPAGEAASQRWEVR